MKLIINRYELNEQDKRIALVQKLIGSVNAAIVDSSERNTVEVSGSPSEIRIALKIVEKYVTK